MTDSKESARKIADAALTDLLIVDESYKMKVRIYKNGDAEIDTDTLEAARLTGLLQVSKSQNS